MDDLVCNWSPKLIVELIKIIVWPIVILIIGFSLRNRLPKIMQHFFSRNTISEVSATLTGVSAKFVAAKQSKEALEGTKSDVASLSPHINLKAIRERQELNKTKLSEELYQAIIENISSFSISDEDKISLLACDLSIFQSGVQYLNINKVLFRSQYNLFCTIANHNNFISKKDAYQHFDIIKNNHKEAFADWDWIKYIAYPVSNNLIYEDNNGYKLSILGNSYISFMSKNPQLVDELVKL